MTRELADAVLNQMLATPWFTSLMADIAAELGASTATIVWSDDHPGWLHVSVAQHCVACLCVSDGEQRGLYMPDMPMGLN